MINADLPITKVEEDILERGTFAKTLARALLNCKFPSSFAIGLYGAWGSGKTSLLNMIIEEIKNIEKDKKEDEDEDEKTVILKFNPWLCSDAKQLVNQFFKQLAAEIHLKEPTADQIWLMIDQYADLFDMTSTIPVVGTALNAAGKALTRRAKNQVKRRENDLQYRKEKIIEALDKNKIRIIVSIDDIDRLSEEEIIAVFQLVKALGDFPSTVYIMAFDYNVVVQALGNVQKGNGKEYLEKIIQVPIEIPAPNIDTIYNLFTSRMADILGSCIQKHWNRTTWTELFQYGIKNYIKSIRDVIRFTNVFQLKFSLLKEETYPIDLIGITLLQVFEPSIFSKLHYYKNILCGSGQLYNLSSADSRNEQVRRAIKELIPENDREVVNPESAGAILALLFPKLREVLGRSNLFSADFSYREFLVDKRVSVPECFDRYFALTLDNNAIPANELKDLIYDLNQEESERKLIQIYQKEKLGRLLEEIAGHANQKRTDLISEDRATVIIQSLIHVWGSFEIEKSESSIGLSCVHRFSTCIDLLLHIVTASNRFALIKSIFDNQDIELSTLSILLRDFESEHGRFTENEEKKDDPLFSLDEVIRLEQIFRNRAIEAINSRAVFKDDNENLFFWWMLEEIDPEYAEAEKEKKLLVKDETSFIKVLDICSNNSGTMTTGYTTKKLRKVNLEELAEFVDVNIAYEKMRDFQSTQQFLHLSENDQLNVLAFLYQIEHPSSDSLTEFGVAEEILKKRLEELKSASI